MTEKELKNLGFEKVTVSAEESGAASYYYYEYNIGSLSFITNANDELKSKFDWYVCLFDYGEFEMTDYEDVKTLIDILTKWLK